MNILIKTIDFIQNLIFTKHCPVCDELTDVFKPETVCQYCLDEIKIIGNNTYSYPNIDILKSFLIYNGYARQCLLNFKMYQNVQSGKFLADQMYEIIKDIPEIKNADFVMFIPYTKVKTGRGYNSAEFLAKRIAKKLKKPILEKCLVKTRENLSQTQCLNAKERFKNVQNTFSCADRQLVKKKNIILIDDVYTTGATMKTCAKLLKNAGASAIYGVTAEKTDFGEKNEQIKNKKFANKRFFMSEAKLTAMRNRHLKYK